MSRLLSSLIILIRGAGEMATGTACRLYRAGFHNILMTEIGAPLAVRRQVSFSEAVHDGSSTVEGTQARLVSQASEVAALWNKGVIAIIVDGENRCKETIRPDVVVDAILAKENLGTTREDAPLVIGLGPGFCAGSDVHVVVETNRGHNLGRLIFDGPASPNTGVPGVIAGETANRVLRAPDDGTFESNFSIGDMVDAGSVVAYVAGKPVTAALSGVIRGLIRPKTPVTKGLKVGDIDPRCDVSYCYTISEKARAIGGAVLEAILMRFNSADGLEIPASGAPR